VLKEICFTINNQVSRSISESDLIPRTNPRLEDEMIGPDSVEITVLAGNDSVSIAFKIVNDVS
jgi:hypothetical protein